VLASTEFRRALPSARRLIHTEEKIVLKIMKSAVLCLALVAIASPASAQMTWTDKGFVNFDLGLQAGSSDFTVNTPFEIYRETGSVSSTQDVSGGGFFNIAAGYKVWRNLAVGIGYTYAASDSDAVIAASVPDPLVFDAHRAVTGSAGDLGHQESQIHISGTWMMPVTDKIDVGLSFGPTFFSVSQDAPNGVVVAEPGATLTSVSVGEIDESTVGFHFGVDVRYMLTSRFGVGGMARFTRGSVDVENATDDLKVGGFQIGGGLRIRF
jgi:hypothetical protein